MTTPAADPIPLATGRDVDFVTGHQDDELVMMGWAFVHHVLAGRRANLLLGTDGSTTSALRMVNGELASGWWGGFHYPEREGYERLTPQDMAEARDLEYLGSGAEVGLSTDRIHLNLEYRGPNIDEDQATALLLRRREQAPDAGVYTHHWLDIDPNHAALGTALKELHTQSPSDWSDVRWMVRPEQIGQIAGAQQYGVPGTYYDGAKVLLTKAARHYASWAPRQGRVAAGYHGVGLSLFSKLLTQPNYFVKP
ncbi:PIG-L family deacetylase [Streptomyces sp. V1I1]|uniref:PIG-L family deacetylase n=1 Tax=Streptomyces sp. V1I1 TaxID=3042272 RepID=UPI0027883471|nr:PIG-L family deacetylase [Streptomyces sp. V1I1]MDQ0943263.1 hypothetical protein [Streptomyces sp. V1I1]